MTLRVTISLNVQKTQKQQLTTKLTEYNVETNKNVQQQKYMADLIFITANITSRTEAEVNKKLTYIRIVSISVLGIFER